MSAQTTVASIAYPRLRHWPWLVLALIALAITFMPLPTGTALPGSRDLHIAASQYEFSPAVISVNRGDRVTIELSSTDVVHGLYLDGYDLEVTADPGQAASLSFIADKSGTFRFRCPLCSRFNTAINGLTNLARCFDCETNFNPIDMVMAVKNTGFVQAVTLLNTCRQTLSHDKKNHPETNLPAYDIPSNASKLHRAGCKPVAIANILSNLMQKKQPHLAEVDQTDSSAHSSTPSHTSAKLQQDICRLSEQIDQLKTIINNQK